MIETPQEFKHVAQMNVINIILIPFKENNNL